MAYYASQLIKTAEREVGYLEKKSNKNLDSKTENAGYNNYTKYGEWFGLNHAYWCAMFVSWCFHAAYGDVGAKKLLCGGFSAACDTLRMQFLKANQFYYVPKVGDLIFFDGQRHSGANHIGIVYKVSGNTVYTIEGNTSVGASVIDNGGGVAKKSYSTSYSRIMGYGRPKYDKEKTATTATTATTAYYKKYTGLSKKIDVVFKAIGVPTNYYGTWKKRRPIAIKNGIENYTGTSAQNQKLIALAKKGKLKK